MQTGQLYNLQNRIKSSSCGIAIVKGFDDKSKEIKNVLHLEFFKL